MKTKNNQITVKTKTKIKSVDKAFVILDIVSNHKDGIPLTEIAAEMGIGKSSAHHLISTLVNNGYLKQNEFNKKYKLGLKTIEIGNKCLKNLSVSHIGFPYLKEIAERINETAYLAKIDGEHLVIIETLNSTHTIRPFDITVAENEYHTSALGKILLSTLDEKTLKSFLGNKGLIKYTKNTITSYNQLKKELGSIIEKRIAFDREEMEDGLFCIASPIVNPTSSIIGAIGVSIPKQRFNFKKENEIAVLIKNAALSISKELGYTQ